MSIYIVSVHTIGSYFGMYFFFHSLMFYFLQSQLSLINDFWTLRKGKNLIKFPFEKISQLYLIASSTFCVLAMLKYGMNKWTKSFVTK